MAYKELFPHLKGADFETFSALLIALVEHFGGNDLFLSKICRKGEISLTDLNRLTGGEIPPYQIINRIICAVIAYEYRQIGTYPLEEKAVSNQVEPEWLINTALTLAHYSVDNFERRRYFHCIQRLDFERSQFNLLTPYIEDNFVKANSTGEVEGIKSNQLNLALASLGLRPQWIKCNSTKQLHELVDNPSSNIPIITSFVKIGCSNYQGELEFGLIDFHFYHTEIIEGGLWGFGVPRGQEEFGDMIAKSLELMKP